METNNSRDIRSIGYTSNRRDVYSSRDGENSRDCRHIRDSMDVNSNNKEQTE